MFRSFSCFLLLAVLLARADSAENSVPTRSEIADVMNEMSATYSGMDKLFDVIGFELATMRSSKKENLETAYRNFQNRISHHITSTTSICYKIAEEEFNKASSHIEKCFNNNLYTITGVQTAGATLLSLFEGMANKFSPGLAAANNTTALKLSAANKYLEKHEGTMNLLKEFVLQSSIDCSAEFVDSFEKFLVDAKSEIVACITTVQST